MADGNRSLHLTSQRGEFCCLTFAKSDNSGGAAGAWLAGLDLDPSESFGGVDLETGDGKAAGELAGGLGSALTGEDSAETVKAFTGEHEDEARFCDCSNNRRESKFTIRLRRHDKFHPL